MLLNEAKQIIYTYNEGFLKTAGKVALVGGALAGGYAAAPYIAKAAAPMIAKVAPIVSSKIAAAKTALGMGGAKVASAAKAGVAPGTGPLKALPNSISSIAKNPLSLKPAIAPGTGPLRPTFVKPTIPTVKPLMKKPF